MIISIGNLQQYFPKNVNGEKEYEDNPFGYSIKDNENIHLNTGAVSHGVVDFTIPGRNGLDLVVKRTYDSTRANLHDFSFQVDPTKRYFYYITRNVREDGSEEAIGVAEVGGPYADATTRNQVKNSALSRLKPRYEEDNHEKLKALDSDSSRITFNYSTALRENTHFIRQHKLGYGWRFNFPSYEEVPVTSHRGKIGYNKVLHMGNGSSYKIQNYNLVDYELEDITLSRASGYFTFPGSEQQLQYSSMVTFKDGLRYYMGDENIVAMENRFGNRIYYHFYDNGIAIYDTYGRTVRLTRDGNSAWWTLPDNKTIRYDVGSNLLTAVYNQEQEKTEYSYYANTTASARLFFSYSGDEIKTTTCHLLEKVKYPTGATTTYTYQKLTEQADPRYTEFSFIYDQHYDTGNRFKEFYALHTRHDHDGAQDSNHQTYSFEVKREKETKERNDYHMEEQYKYHISKATVTDSNRGVTETHLFNGNGLCTNTTIQKGITTISQTDTRYGTGNSFRLPINEETVQFGVHRKITTWDYHTDKKGNVREISESYPSAPEAEQTARLNQVTTMNYNAYSQLTSKEYYKSGSVTLKEEYHYLSDLAVEYALLYEGGHLKQKTGYAYDGAWNISEERRYYGDMNSQYYSTAFAYEQSVPSPTSKTTAGITIRYTYDAYGRVLTQTDGIDSHVTTFTYDGLGRVTNEAYADGTSKVNRYEVSSTTNFIETTDERGEKKWMSYTPLGKIQSVTAGPYTFVTHDEPYGRMTHSYTYNNRGLLEKETVYGTGTGRQNAPRNHTYYTYDHLDRPLSKITKDASNEGITLYEESYSYNDAVDGRYFVETKTVGNIVTTTKKDQRGNVVEETVAGVASTFTYDKLGNKLSAADSYGNTVRWDYDHAGQVVREYKVHKSGEIYAETTYDALGLKRHFRDFRGFGTDYDYDALGRLEVQTADFDITGARTTTSYEYDNAGNVRYQRVSCNAIGAAAAIRQTEYTYDLRNRVEDTIQRDGSTEYRTRNIYDNAGNKREVYTGMLGNSLAGAAKTVYTYDGMGNMTSMKDPAGYSESYTYSPAGQLTSKTDRNGHTTSYTYDGMLRVTKETVSAANAHGQTTSTRAYGFNALGQKVREDVTEAAPEGSTSMSVTYAYDNMGRLSTQTDTADGVAVKKQYGYDNNGNRTTFQLSRNGALEINMSYGYDNQNRMKWVRRNNAEIARYDYDQNGNRISLTQGGVTTGYGYNRANLVTSMSNGAVSGYRYKYYLDGNQQEKEDKTGKIVTYEYDGLGRLRRERDPDWQTIVYTYDRFGNRERMDVTDVNPAESHVTTYTYHSNNWLLTETKQQGKVREVFHYQYDKNGNQCYREWEKLESAGGDSPGRVGFASGEKMKTREKILELRSYNGFGQMVWLYRDGDVATYRYRPDGLRHSKTTGLGATTHLWDGQNIVMETSANGSVKSRFFRGVNLIAQEIDGGLQYYLFNAHGDVVQKLAANGTVYRDYDYNAFGVEKDEVETDQNPFRYCGEYWDKESEEYYLRARYYNPRLGRMSTEDSVIYVTHLLINELEVVDPLSLNRYTYAKSNPVVYKDSIGKSAQAILEGSWILGGIISQIDTPVPGPADIIGLGVGIIGTIVAGGVLLYELVTSDATEDVPDAPSEQGTEDSSSKKDDDVKAPEYPGDDPTQSPGEDWEWRGPDDPGGDKGAWYNPKTGETMKPDLGHKEPVGPHWDYIPRKNGQQYRLYPDGSFLPK